jgi:LAO/AO transport system kinase
MDKEKVAEKAKAVSKNGKISCKQALKLAEDEGVGSRELGELLNELKIKVASCQLGCFP